ncbi:ADP-ribosylation factor-like protein 6-interacting protein 1 [Toxorhynchites rutilus septentrionalis]|uniref:ADP-ribosylation factor-like protein 6-interacting protein 1 n=1 Tax=Toxorhynchites rutilus septentrionalis TaxID=329112 RepID=UPI00247A6F15|nr:ADP-ribosylation factor-like protein 6-interacting protein 1 [Toxorhynchites rutilus septentrionalis]
MSELKKKEFNRLKNDLDAWREIILFLHDLLDWKYPYSCGWIVSGITALYLVLWKLDLSIVTQLSLLCLFGLLGAFFYPVIAKLFFKPEKWTGVQEKHFEIVINKLLNVKFSVVDFWNTFFWNIADKSIIHVFKTSGVLLGLAWIGASVNNLLLIYLTTLTMCLWPGISQLDEFHVKLNMLKKKLNLSSLSPFKNQ